MMLPLLRWTYITAGAILTLLALSYSFRSNVRPGFGESMSGSPLASSDNDTLLSHIQNATAGFERIFVISLPSRTDRRDSSLLAAVYTGLEIEFVDAVDGDKYNEKTFPPGGKFENFNKGQIGCMRSHLNALQKIVHEGISSALIFEDDADWDLRLKSQFTQFALASRILSQPLASNPKSHADPTFPKPQDSGDFEQPVVEFTLEHHVDALAPSHSPYGDSWDVLWFGHCGTRFPEAERDNTQRGRVVIRDDETVVDAESFQAGFGSMDIVELYPSHTRVIHHTAENVCSLAYAVSQRAARQMLYQFSLLEFDAPYDLMIRKYCDGENGRNVRNCYTATPTLYEHFRPRGNMNSISDISDFQGFNEHDNSANIRLSARVNLQRLTDNEAPLDQYPDPDPDPDV